MKNVFKMFKELILVLNVVLVLLRKTQANSEYEQPKLCSQHVKYNVTVLITEEKPHVVREFTWCLAIPPRCSTYVTKIETVVTKVRREKERTEPSCCNGWQETPDSLKCEPVCPKGCINGNCIEPGLCRCRRNYAGADCAEVTTLLNGYMDEFVTIQYQNSALMLNLPFKKISLAWDYIETKYIPAQYHHRISLTLNDHDSNKCVSFNTQKNTNFSHYSIECSTNATGKLISEVLDILLPNIVEQMIDVTNKLTSAEYTSWSPNDDSTFQVTSLLIYDALTKLEMTAMAKRWVGQVLKNSNSSTGAANADLFRNFYYPLYALHGNTTLLSNFLTILEENWFTNKNQNTRSEMNLGELIHFWSGAVGVNLLKLGEVMLDRARTNETEAQFFQARMDYSNVTYVSDKTTKPQTFVITEPTLDRPQLLKDVYSDSHVTIFFDPSLSLAVDWPFYLLSTYWNFMTLYEESSQSTDPHLHVIFHDKHSKVCNYSESFQMSTEFGTQEFNNTIDCGHQEGASDTWAIETIQNLDLVTNVVPSKTKDRDPVNKNDSLSSRAGKHMFNIVAFDRYLAKFQLEDAHAWLSKKKKQGRISAVGSKFWFWDWFVPIYTDFGGSHVLDRFVDISEERLREVKNNSWAGNDELNVGEFTHLWSAAAGENLRYLAAHCHSWNEEIQTQFLKARNTLRSFYYTCMTPYSRLYYPLTSLNCDKIPGKTPAVDQGMFQQNLPYTIIGLLAGAVVSLCIAYSVRSFVLQRRIKRLRQEIRNLTADEVDEFFKGKSSKTDSNGKAEIFSLPFNSINEIPKDRLIIHNDKVLGSGEFGIVVCGTLEPERNKRNVENAIEVAVKTVKASVEVSYFKALLSEVKIMAHIGSHENVISLLGTVTKNIKNRELYVALEFCPKGDLLGYLKSQRDRFVDLLYKHVDTDGKCVFRKEPDLHVILVTSGTTKTYEISTPISTVDLLQWSIQIANGMEYLASKNVIHGDLAARNVLLTANSVAKISDFGLSRRLINYSHYLKTSKTPLPFRWMAVESLVDGLFSVNSDIWAFGVTLWEIFTLEKVPYAGMRWTHEFVKEITEGLRLKSPDFASEEIYNIMLDCTKLEPTERIPFREISRRLNLIKQKL